MALIRWKPRSEVDPFFKGYRDLQDEINRMFNYALGGWPSERDGMGGGEWAPPVNVLEDKDNVVITADLPGMTDKDIDVAVLGDTLTIKGEKKREEKKDEGSYHMFERTYGAFQRSVALPTSVENDKAKASFKNGVLEVKIPKKEEARPKQIEIKIE